MKPLKDQRNGWDDEAKARCLLLITEVFRFSTGFLLSISLKGDGGL